MRMCQAMSDMDILLHIYEHFQDVSQSVLFVTSPYYESLSAIIPFILLMNELELTLEHTYL